MTRADKVIVVGIGLCLVALWAGAYFAHLTEGTWARMPVEATAYGAGFLGLAMVVIGLMAYGEINKGSR